MDVPQLPPEAPKRRGFAVMDRELQRRIASKGGRMAHLRHTAHEFTSAEARAAGQLGGLQVSRDRQHMADIGRQGGRAAGRGARGRPPPPPKGGDDRGGPEEDSPGPTTTPPVQCDDRPAPRGSKSCCNVVGATGGLSGAENASPSAGPSISAGARV